MKMTMIRRPKAVGRRHNTILKEVRQAYNKLADASIEGIMAAILDWDTKPKIEKRVTVSKKKWVLTIKIDTRTKEGKIFKWVDEGTATYADPPGEPYIIQAHVARSRGLVNYGYLRYNLPSATKSMPASGIPSPSSQAPPGTVVTQSVLHPGIDPRHFTKPIIELLKSRRAGSFRNETEAAIKRGIRKL